jgi:glyoxylase-like metal-dependent hydrolase (beta-lactamase superfamily II)
MKGIIATCVAAVLGVAGVVQPTVAQQNRQGLEILPVQGNIYMIAGAGGNIAVQIGDAGVLVVDTGSGKMTDQVLAAIRQLSNKPIRFIINTHHSADTTGGNEALAKGGSSIPEITVGTGRLFADQDAIATIAAHENVQKRMSAPVGQPAPTPTAAWPVVTYFGDEKEMYFNGEPVILVHVPDAHSDGDSLVFFRHSDVVVVGDTFTTASYPVIDLEGGGTINGIIAALNRIIDITIPAEKQEGGTYVIPTHGRICDEADVVTYRDMVTIIRDRVQDMVSKGMTLQQVKAAKPTEDFDTHFVPTAAWTTDMFVEAVYRTLPPPAAAPKAGQAQKPTRTPAGSGQRR